MKRLLLGLTLTLAALAALSFGTGRLQADVPPGTCAEVGGVGSGVYAGSECVFAVDPGAEPLLLVRALLGSNVYSPVGYPATGVPGSHQFWALEATAPANATVARVYDARLDQARVPPIAWMSLDGVKASGIIVTNAAMYLTTDTAKVTLQPTNSAGSKRNVATFDTITQTTGDATAMSLVVMRNGIKTIAPTAVRLGPPDSCGIGQRCLTVAN